ncbi:MAG TPA: aminotransferase class V-fold PLP-dependent enzyme [Gaiellaceae bacterium]|nr:aminotransferase class V-fold PLP-dependent enzyme [Gaiellaceae bacterium]
MTARVESTDAMAAAFDAFRRRAPTFDSTASLDELRLREYSRLDEGDHIYLDYTGGGLYADSQLRAHMDLLRENVFGNPHSVNPTSSAMTRLVERARARVLEYFNASPDEYTAIFTPNATGALRLVGEAYPFRPGDRFLLTFDNHNSVNGIREFARARGAETSYVPSVAPDLRVDENVLLKYLDEIGGSHHNLFAYPAQSNFSGVQHPLEWIEEAQARDWHVLVDCAAFVPTNRLDLSRWHPDFVPLSFYKLFGYPTGVGCLLARNDALARLERPWFSGGTIVAATVQRDWHRQIEGFAAFEDGTVNYLTLPAIEIGLDHVDSAGIDTVHERVSCLGAWLLDELQTLRHSDGRPAIEIYGPRTWTGRGATIAFNFLHPSGRWVDERFVDRVAEAHNVSVRTGCFCNPGSGELAFSIAKETLIGGEFETALVLDDYVAAIGLPSGGAVRVSLGLPTNFADVYRFVEFARALLDVTEADVPDDLPPRLAC